MVSKTTYYRRQRKSRETGIPVDQLPDNRGKHGKGKRGSSHYRWNKNLLLDKAGYVLTRVGKCHPLADPNGYCHEHKLILCSSIGRNLYDGEVIHHVNEDKRDNRLENLKLLTIAEHNQIHNRDLSRDAKNRFVGKHAPAGQVKGMLDGEIIRECPE